MQISKDALLPRASEIQMLENAHDGLEKNNSADNNKADDGMSVNGVIEIVKVVAYANSERHAADHHDEGEDLDRHVDGEDLVAQVRVAEEGDLLYGEVDGGGAEREEYDECDGHDAGVGVAFAVEDFEGVEVTLLHVGQGVVLLVTLCSEDHFWGKGQHERRQREGMELHHGGY